MSTLPPDHEFPAFLTPVFGPTALDRTASPVAALDARFQILWVNAAWRQIAHDHGGATYVSYLDGISGVLRTFYEEVFTRALQSGEVFEQDYDCHSADEHRRYRMRVLPFAGDGMLVEHTLIASHPPSAEAEPAIAERYFDASGLILQCSNCRRVRAPDAGPLERWAWVPAWVERSHPRTSHGICTPCMGFYWRRNRRKQ